MAFATASPKLHSAGNLWRQTGTWTGSIGDATGTMTVKGKVYEAKFDINDGSSQEDTPVPFTTSYSTTTGLTTISVYNKSTVTDGKYSVLYV